MSSSPPDKSLTERLNKLRGQQSIDQKELEERIARLKGIDPAKFTSPPIIVYRPPDTRSDTQKADDLMKAMMSETAIDLSLEKSTVTAASIEEIEKRLQSLRGVSGDDAPQQKTVFNDDSDLEMDSDTECELITKKLLEETKLPDVTGIASSRGGQSSDTCDKEDPDSQPWCVICNEDAVVVCENCDDDLYCMDCFKWVLYIWDAFQQTDINVSLICSFFICVQRISWWSWYDGSSNKAYF